MLQSRCALVTGVQTWALPISVNSSVPSVIGTRMARSMRTGVSGLPGYVMRLNARRASRLMQVLRANRTSLPSERRRFLACLHALDGAENDTEIDDADQ